MTFWLYMLWQSKAGLLLRKGSSISMTSTELTRTGLDQRFAVGGEEVLSTAIVALNVWRAHTVWGAHTGRPARY